MLPACNSDSPRRERRDRGEAAASREDDIRAVVRMNDAEEIGRRDAREALDMFSDALQEIAPPDARRGIRQLFGDAEDEFDRVDVEAIAVEVYARHLSDRDARALREFYETPAGRRIAAAQSDIARDLSDEGERVGEDIGARLVERLENGEYSGFAAPYEETRRERRRRLRDR